MADETKTAQTVTNTSDGPRGFWEGGNLVMLEKGDKAVADLTDSEKKAVEAYGCFEVKRATAAEKKADEA